MSRELESESIVTSHKETTMVLVLLWLLGVPLALILILALFGIGI